MVTRVGKELGVEIICAQTDYEGEMCQLVSFRRHLSVGHALCAQPLRAPCRRSFPLRALYGTDNCSPLTRLKRTGALLSVSRRRSHEPRSAQPRLISPVLRSGH